MSNGTFDFNEFLKESKDVLVNPKLYFSTMKTSGGMTEPLIKAVIYGAIAGALSFLWSILRIAVVGNSIFGSAFGIMLFVWAVVWAVIGLFVGAVILLVISAICKGNTDFEANVRVAAAAMVIMPISAFFGFAGHFNLYFGIIAGLAINLYALWILYNGLIEALKTNTETTKIVMYVFIALIVLMMLAGFGVKRRADQLMNQFNNSDFKELVKDNDKK
jgi:hypothetical protein